MRGSRLLWVAETLPCLGSFQNERTQSQIEALEESQFFVQSTLIGAENRVRPAESLAASHHRT